MKRLALLVVIGCASLAAQEKGGAEAGDKYAVWKWANFAILAVLVGYMTNKHLPPFLRARTGEIQKGIAEAQQMKREAETRAAGMDARLRELGADIETFRVQAHAEMQQEGERIRQETAAHIRRMEQQATMEIESAGKTARRELRAYAADLALDMAGQRIRTRLDTATDAQLVDGFVKDLERQGMRN
jgi:F-type H+-transporting ATPase subunit b